jgi:hypothetical protein
MPIAIMKQMGAMVLMFAVTEAALGKDFEIDWAKAEKEYEQSIREDARRMVRSERIERVRKELSPQAIERWRSRVTWEWLELAEAGDKAAIGKLPKSLMVYVHSDGRVSHFKGREPGLRGPVVAVGSATARAQPGLSQYSWDEGEKPQTFILEGYEGKLPRGDSAYLDLSAYSAKILAENRIILRKK